MEGEAEYRAGPIRYRVVGDELVRESSREETEERIDLATVTKVRIYTMQGRGFCFVTPGSGKVMQILSHLPSTPDNQRAYVAFIRKLHQKLATTAPAATYVAGHGAFLALMVVSVVGMVAVAGVVVLALVKGAGLERVGPLAAPITLPMLTLAGVSRVRPRKYSRGVPPRAFLPPVD